MIIMTVIITYRPTAVADNDVDAKNDDDADDHNNNNNNKK